jgi:hypothetical protein
MSVNLAPGFARSACRLAFSLFNAPKAAEELSTTPAPPLDLAISLATTSAPCFLLKTKR